MAAIGSRLTETVYRRKLRPFGKTPGSMTTSTSARRTVRGASPLEGRIAKLGQREVPPGAFIFPNADGGFLDVGNYRFRVLTPLAEKLGIPRAELSDPAADDGHAGAEDGIGQGIQSHLRHSRPDTTANEYMQELPESVQAMVGSVYLMLTQGGRSEGGFRRNAAKRRKVDRSSLVSA